MDDLTEETDNSMQEKDTIGDEEPVASGTDILEEITEEVKFENKEEIFIKQMRKIMLSL